MGSPITKENPREVTGHNMEQSLAHSRVLVPLSQSAACLIIIIFKASKYCCLFSFCIQVSNCILFS